MVTWWDDMLTVIALTCVLIMGVNGTEQFHTHQPHQSHTRFLPLMSYNKTFLHIYVFMEQKKDLGAKPLLLLFLKRSQSIQGPNCHKALLSYGPANSKKLKDTQIHHSQLTVSLRSSRSYSQCTFLFTASYITIVTRILNFPFHQAYLWFIFIGKSFSILHFQKGIKVVVGTGWAVFYCILIIFKNTDLLGCSCTIIFRD